MHKLIISVTVVGSFLAFVPEARALDAECMSKLGDCSVSNAPQDSLSCECTDGNGIGGGGGNEWAGLNQLELQAVCEEQLASFCGPPGPIDGVPCESELGACVVDNEPDSVSCECAGGLGGAGGGGNEWDGLSDEELEGVCFEQLEVFCGDPPDPEWLCENEQGGCTISTDEDVAVFCGCAGGGGGGGPGEPEWVDLGKDELLDVCFMQIAEFCGPIDPSDSDSDSDSESDSDPSDTSASESGSSDETGGSSDTSGDETGETTAAEAGESSSSEGGDSSGASATATMTASATDSDSDSATMTDPSASASNTAGEESSSGGDGGATGEASGCSCNAANDEPPLPLALGLVGLVGMRLRRRGRR